MRTVIVGFGKSAHVDAKMKRWFPKGAHHLNMAPPFELVGVADRSHEARHAAWEQECRCSIVTEAASLAVHEPEVAVLAIPPEGRAEALAALPSVKAVMLEKPLGPPSVREPLLELIEKRKIVTQVNYWRRGDPTLRALPDIGPAQAAFGLYGGGLRNNGSHLIDTVRMLLGEVTVCARWNAVWGESAFALEHENGQVAIQPLRFSKYREILLDLWGATGRIAFQQEGVSINHYPRGPHRGLESANEIACDAPTTLPCRVGEALPALYANLARAVTDGEELLSPLSSAIATERVLDHIESLGIGP